MTLSEVLKNANNSNSFFDYVQGMPENGFRHTEELIDELSVAQDTRNAWLLEDLLSIAMRDGVDVRFTDVLTRLIKAKWHDRQEDIVWLFEKIRDPASVEIIYEMAINIPGNDDGRGLAQKCIWVLGAINSKEAIEKLELLHNMNDPIIKEKARMELNAPKKGR